MSKNQEGTNLCYGQGILIKGYNSTAEQSEGVLTAKGFADIRALYETYDDVLYFKNYRNSIFQILPASSFDINDELKYIVSNNLTTNESNMAMLKAKAESQKNQFDLNVQNKHTNLVCFGDEVVFKHIDSGTYLSGTITPSDGVSGAFLVEVTKDLKSSLIFKLRPYRSFQNDSSSIPLNSPVVIENVSNKGFLTFEKIGFAQKDQKNLYWNKSSIKSDQSYRIPIKTESSSSEIYDCVTHFSDLSKQNADSTMPWKFQLHFNDPNNEELIQHDIVFFQHTQNNGVLAAIGEEEIALKELKGQKTSELCFFDCLWEIEEHKTVGDDAYIIRHLMSGMTLGVEVMNSTTEKKLRPKLVDISDGKGDGTILNLGVVDLRKAKKEGGIIESDSYVNICSDDMVLDIKREKKIGTKDPDTQGLDFNGNMEEKKIIDPVRMATLAANQFNYEIKKLEFTLDVSQHCFIIKEIGDDLKSQVLFALSFHSRLIKLRQDLKWGAQKSEEKVTYLRLMQITSKVKEIKYFLKNTTIDDPNREFKRPIEKKQIICYHLGISELLFEVLFFMKKNLKGQTGEGQGKVQGIKIFEKKPNQKQKFMELYNAIYQVVFELIRDNYQFKVHVSKWFMFILDDVEVYGDEYMLKTLLELLKSNIFFVNNFVTEDLVQHLVEMLPNVEILADKQMKKVFHERKYIEIFRAFCICGKEVFSQNQILILDKFLKRLNSEKYENYDIKIVKKKDKDGNYGIMCEAAVDKQTRRQRKFKDYHKICEDQYKSAWSYLISFLNLIADMVQGRNKTVEGHVETLLTAQAISDLLINEELFEAEAPLIRIMHYLYAESPSFYPIDQATRVISWETLDEQTKLNCTKSRNQPSDNLTQVMESIIKKLKSYRPIRMQQEAENGRLLVILDFVRETFSLGFWREKSRVLQIFECIKTLLTPPDDIDYTLIKAQSQKKEVVLMVNCKEKCLQILDHIINLDIDYNVNYFSKAFKNFKIPSKKIEVQISNFLEVSQQCHFAVDFFNEYKNLTKQFDNMVSIDICKKMIELSKHGHPRLTSYSLRVLQRILDMDNKVSYNFTNLIFIAEQERKDLYEYIFTKRDKFFTLQYQNTTKINMNNQKSHYHMVYKEDDNPDDAGIMQDMHMISELIKNQNHLSRIGDVKSLDASRTFKNLAEQKLINFTNERRSSNMMKQQILDASNMHQKVLTYILNCREIPTEELAKKLLHLCYKFMVSIIENNQSVKLTLMQYIPRIKHHIKKNVGCVDFLKEMYDNNKNMLFNETEILDLIKLICKAIDEEIQSFSNYKSKLLDFFRYLIYCNGRALKWNQIQILKIMQDEEYQNILIFQKSRITSFVKRFEQENFSEQADEDVIQPIKIEPELNYFTTLFQIMVSLIDGKCEVNMGKLVKKYPFKDLVEMLKQADRCWPLKRNIRAFLNRLYYFQPEIETYMGTIIGEEINNIITDLNHFIDIKSKINAEDYQKRTFENPVRFSYIQSYLYLNLEQNLFTLHQLVKKKEILEQLKNHLHSKKNMNSKQAPYQFIRICERLGWIRNYFSSKKNIFTTSFIKHLLKHLKDIISEFDDNIYADGMLFNGERMPSKSEKDRQRKVVIDRIMQGEITSFYVQSSPQINKQKPLVYLLPPKIIMPPDEKNPNKEKLIRKLRQILTKTVIEFKTKDDEIRYNQQKMISALQLSEQVKEEFTKSYNDKLNRIQCDQQTFIDYISSIIMINNQDPNAFSSDLKLFFLKMIIGKIEQANKTEMEEKKSIDTWDPQDWESSRGEIETIQVKLKKCGLQSFISNLLKEKIEDNIELANEILLCGIAFLLGGNQATQKTLIEEIIKDPDNRVFRNLSILISKLGKLILKNIDESNFKPTDSDDFQITIIDNYDFYDQDEKYCRRKNVIEPSTTNEIIYHRQCIATYRRAFRFLQLLCENNNIQNKNLIRDQGKGGDVVDFITTTTNELRNLFSVFCKSIEEVPLFLLEFLIQVTQIPVKKNQEALTNSSFFEDVCQMNNQFEKVGKLAARNFDDNSSPLDDILHKTIQIILSMFQGNNKATFRTVDTKIEPKFLTTILENKFKTLNINNKTDLLFYIKSTLQTMDENGNLNAEAYYGEEMMKILDIFIIFKKLKDVLGDQSRIYKSYRTLIKRIDGKNNQFADICEFLENCLISIQVVNNPPQKQIVYFPKHPCYYSLSGTTKDYIMGQVKRGSHRDKIVTLFNYIISLKGNLEYSYSMKKSQGIEEKDMYKNYNIASTLSIIICIYLMVFYHVIIQFGEAQFKSNRIIRSGCFFLSLIQLSFSLIYFWYWFRLRVWLKPEVIDNSSDTSIGSSNTSANTSVQSDSIFKKILFYIIPKVFLQRPSQTHTFYNNGQFYRILIFVLVSFAGTFINPIVFYIHIIDIFCQAEMLASIFKAIALNIQSLMYISLLGAVFVGIFCTITFSNYMKNLYEEESPQMCHDMISCILALYISGAIGQMEQFQLTRFFYDLIYSTFFGILFSNIVSGIMLDSFASLREKTQELQTDKSDFCYICNISRERLEKKGIKFHEHTRKKHFLWNYVFYLISLRNKDSTDYTGLQYEINTQYHQKDQDMKIDWVPEDEETDIDYGKYIEQLNAMTENFEKMVEENEGKMEEKIQKIKEILEA